MQGSMNPKQFIFFPRKLVPCSVTTSNQTILSVVLNTLLNDRIKSFTQYLGRVQLLSKNVE